MIVSSTAFLVDTHLILLSPFYSGCIADLWSRGRRDGPGTSPLLPHQHSVHNRKHGRQSSGHELGVYRSVDVDQKSRLCLEIKRVFSSLCPHLFLPSLSLNSPSRCASSLSLSHSLSLLVLSVSVTCKSCWYYQSPSGGEDGVIRCWDLRVSDFNEGHRYHRLECVCVCVCECECVRVCVRLLLDEIQTEYKIH